MPCIAATEIALPRCSASQSEVGDWLASWLADRVPDPERVLRIVERSGVGQRYSVLPPDEVFQPRSFEARNRLYTEASIELAERVSRAALCSSDLPSGDVGLIVSVSCTGFMIPSVDAYLVNLLPLSRHIVRLPITELGCAAGAMGLSRSTDWLLAHPESSALLVSVELPSLSFQPEDLSMAHLVSCALFGDGAAGVVLHGAESPHARRGQPEVVASRTCFFYDTLRLMGFEVRQTGFHMLLDPGIPDLIRTAIWPALEEFLDDQGLQLGDVDHWLIHPGGRRILDELESLIGRGADALRHSRRVLELYGNLSSGSVLFLLDEFRKQVTSCPGDRALLVAFGPGFNAEMLLLEWPPA